MSAAGAFTVVDLDLAGTLERASEAVAGTDPATIRSAIYRDFTFISFFALALCTGSLWARRPLGDGLGSRIGVPSPSALWLPACSTSWRTRRCSVASTAGAIGPAGSGSPERWRSRSSSSCSSTSPASSSESGPGHRGRSPATVAGAGTARWGLTTSGRGRWPPPRSLDSAIGGGRLPGRQRPGVPATRAASARLHRSSSSPSRCPCRRRATRPGRLFRPRRGQ